MASPLQGYYRFPTIHEDRVVFVAEDDLWEVPISGGVARRLTTSLSTVSTPRFSPDGRWLAFTGAEDGPQEVYLMPSLGGQVRRLTWLGSAGRVLGWRDERTILFSSASGQPLRQPEWIFQVNMDGTEWKRLAYGPANRIGFSGNITVLGRRNGDPARWKRYRGGTAGDIWIDPDGGGEFRKLLDLKGNLADPMMIGSRVFFLSDHDGIGNVYSSYPNGSDLQRHTDHREFYARNASSDGHWIVYHAGADLYWLDPKTGVNWAIEVEFHSSRAQTHRKFVEAARYLQDYDPAPNGSLLAFVCRGKSFAMGCWEWPAAQQGARQGVRYRLSRFLNDGKRLAICSDEGGQEHLEIHWADNSQPPSRVETPDLGRPTEMKISPVADAALLTNHRQQLLYVNLESGEMKELDRDKYQMIGGFCWSPDGRWAAYGSSVNLRQSVIKVCEIESGEIHEITRPILSDYEPAFDPEGKYLYFLSGRIFNPVYDRLHFDAGFPRGSQPFLVTLRKDVVSPFFPDPEGFKKKKKDNNEDSLEAAGKDDVPDDEETLSGEGEKAGKPKNEKNQPITIDFDDIENRIVPIPAAEGVYSQIAAIKGRVLYSALPVEGALGQTWFDTAIPAKAILKAYDFKKREEITVADGITNFRISRDGSALALQIGRRLRVVASDTDSLADKDKGANGDKPGRKSGWIDLARPKVSIAPTDEWRQMLAEAWRLQRDYFWTEDMSKVDWDGVLNRYLPLVDRIASRTEFADLIWEMQGELGTSHAYEMGGDYRPKPQYSQGYLGADFSYDETCGAWRIERIVPGDTWDAKNAPPLLRPGANVSEGMLLLAVGGERLDRETPPQKLLVNLAGEEIALTVAKSDKSSQRQVRVKALESETALRYRAWVENNRRYVHEKTGGAAGYIHIPDMAPPGYAEFHRGFLSELDYDGLVVDVRFNGGGHFSQLLLEKLARRRVGYEISRWMSDRPYPNEAPKGPMVCLTNEFAGSDGDIVCQAFKLMKLGKVIGRRTWGGVIGIWPRNALVDGTLTTQPEFSFWFQTVGWGVENYGVEPDVEVDIRPQDWAAERDPQLDRASAEVLDAIKANPPHTPDFSQRPDLGVRL